MIESGLIDSELTSMIGDQNANAQTPIESLSTKVHTDK